MKHVLLVEDDEDLCIQLSKSLRRAGYSVEIAADGYAALNSKLDNYDLLITDIYMPGLNGLELLMEIRDTYPRLKTIAISGGGLYKNKDILQLADKFGADYVLEKPFLDASLIATVSELLGE